MEKNGLIESSDIEKHLKVSKPTALRTMTEFYVLGIVDKIELGEENNSPMQFRLDSDFKWFLSDDFRNLRNDFGKEYHSEYIRKKESRNDDSENS